MHQPFVKFRWVLFAVFFAFFATAHAQRSYRSFLEAGNTYLQRGDYGQAIRQFRAAKISDDAKKNPEILLMLDGKIEEAFNRQITQLEAEGQRERKMRIVAEEAKKKVEAALDKAEEARRKAHDLSLLLLTTKVEYEVRTTRNLQLGMRLTAFAMRCIDPGNPLFLREFMKSYNASRTAASVIPIPMRWSAKMSSYQAFALSGNAKVFALCSFSKPYLTIFQRTANGNIVCTDSLDYKFWSISLSPDGNQLAFHTFTPSDRGQVFILRGAAGAAAQRRIDTLRIGDSKQILNMAYYTDSPRLAISCKDSILVFDTDKMQRLCALAQSPGTSQIKPLAVHSAKSGNILIETGPEEVIVWDCTPGKIRQRQVLVCPKKITSMQVIWSKNILITGMEEGMLKLWDFTTGAELNSLNVDNDEKDPVATIAVTSDGKYIATGLSEGRVAVWELKADHDLELVLELPAQLGGSKTIGLEFLPGTLQLLVAYNDGNALLWDLDPKAVEENLRAKSAALIDKDFQKQVVERLHLYELLSGNPNGIDSLIESNDAPMIIGIAAYLEEKITEFGYSIDKASSYFKDAERLYLGLLKLDNRYRAYLSQLYLKWYQYFKDLDNAIYYKKEYERHRDISFIESNMNISSPFPATRAWAVISSLFGYETGKETNPFNITTSNERKSDVQLKAGGAILQPAGQDNSQPEAGRGGPIDQNTPNSVPTTPQKSNVTSSQISEKGTESRRPLSIADAHISLLSGKFGAAIQAYNGLLDYSASRTQEVKNDDLVSSFRRLARSNIWAKDRSKQMLVEKALRLIGVPLVADTTLADAYGIAPLQTLGMPLGDLIGSIKGAEALTKTQVARILSLYKHEAKEELAPRISELSKAGNFNEAGLLAVRQAAIFREIYSAQENSGNKANLAEALGNVSYYLLFSGQYKTCIRAAEDAFALSGQYWVQTNRAHAYLLSGNKAKAFEIYKDIKDRRDETRRDESKVPPLRDAILSDLETLISEGVRHEAFPEVAALMLGRALTDEERVRYGGK